MTNAEIRIDTERLGEKLRQWRVENGLSPDPKRIEPFVSVPLSLALMDRLQPFIAISIKYAAILASGTLHRVDTSKFNQYAEYVALLQFSNGTWCKWASSGIRSMLRIMERLNETADEDVNIAEVLRNIHFAIEMMRHELRQDEYKYANMFPRDLEKERAAYDEIKRLRSDPEAFEAALEDARRQYVLTIKGDTDNYECE